ncbi:PP2C family protein-serine/threonine phosphatase [Streptomyces sp. WMMB 322]|uniref:PP2C family protein-serine/threonine phosphatase n=1 Tax=Streptomyces sp. WMMB 322 TaxID=1286821 RepID=UPI0006E18F47|nr:PP2C family protein-serine/threonine phosphatase [Streptomyces sp. WMMB 322]SCK13184.1 Serine phosphatase RsbU, regulator of sigma subunit [Streptomyces sp. WMMB 322]
MRTRDGGLLLFLLPYIAIGLAVAADLAAGPSLGLLPLIAIGPAFATLTGGLRHVASVALLSLVLSVLLSLYDGLFGTERGITVLVAVLGTSIASLLATRLRQRQHQKLARARAVAKVAHRILLGDVPETLDGLQAAVSYSSATRDARVGGDFYEAVRCRDGVRAVVGDVQGKGLNAVERAAVVLGAYRVAAYDEVTLAGVGRCMERAAGRNLSEEAFATVILAEANADGAVTLINYGHPSPLIVRGDGTACFAEPAEPALPLGLSNLGRGHPTPYRVVLDPGDQMLLYTDGITEARNAAGRFYPLGERASLLRAPDACNALEALRSDVVAHTGGPLADDAAMLLLRR